MHSLNGVTDKAAGVTKIKSINKYTKEKYLREVRTQNYGKFMTVYIV